tara:strand:+ start:1198 stop:1404 length:207 start_codon:yes stop_codon:yes gene_type:complete
LIDSTPIIKKGNERAINKNAWMGFVNIKKNPRIADMVIARGSFFFDVINPSPAIIDNKINIGCIEGGE